MLIFQSIYACNLCGRACVPDNYWLSLTPLITTGIQRNFDKKWRELGRCQGGPKHQQHTKQITFREISVISHKT